MTSREKCEYFIMFAASLDRLLASGPLRAETVEAECTKRRETEKTGRVYVRKELMLVRACETQPDETFRLEGIAIFLRPDALFTAVVRQVEPGKFYGKMTVDT